MKNKTLSTWLAFVGGPLGLHRFYLYGLGDLIGWTLPMPTALGLYGLTRARDLGLDDPLSWLLIPLLGLMLAGCCLNAIWYGLMAEERWNARFNAGLDPNSQEHEAGRGNWLTIIGVIGSLMVGATALVGALAYGFQRYFEWQIELARQISQ
jgi:hypothetical protein